MSDDELLCREVAEILTEYLDGAMAADERIRLEQHLLICEGCTSYVEQFRETIRLTGRLAEEPIPAETATKLLDVFRAWRAS